MPRPQWCVCIKTYSDARGTHYQGRAFAQETSSTVRAHPGCWAAEGSRAAQDAQASPDDLPGELGRDSAWLQTGAAAQWLGVSRETVRLWAHSGRLPFQRTEGGAFLFNPADVKALRGAGQADEAWPAVLVADREWERLDGWDGHERGGFVFGQDLRDRLVVEAVEEDPDPIRTARSVSLDIVSALEVERVQAPGTRCLGSWHGHPPGSSPFASEQDLASWRSSAAVLRRLWLGVIVTESLDRSQIEAKVTGYLTRPDGECRRIAPVRLA